MSREKKLILDEEAYVLRLMTSGEKSVMGNKDIPDINLVARYLYQDLKMKPKEIRTYMTS